MVLPFLYIMTHPTDSYSNGFSNQAQLWIFLKIFVLIFAVRKDMKGATSCRKNLFHFLTILSFNHKGEYVFSKSLTPLGFCRHHLQHPNKSIYWKPSNSVQFNVWESSDSRWVMIVFKYGLHSFKLMIISLVLVKISQKQQLILELS